MPRFPVTGGPLSSRSAAKTTDIDVAGINPFTVTVGLWDSTVAGMSGLIHRYKMSEAAGATQAADSVGSNPAVAHGGVTFGGATANPDGTGHSVLLNGTSGYLEVDGSDIGAQSALTVVALVNLAASPQPYPTIAALNSGITWTMVLANYGTLLETTTNTNVLFAGSSWNQQWAMIGVSFAGATVTMYVGGQQVATGAGVLNIPGVTPVTLGARAAANTYFGGSMQEVLFFNRALVGSDHRTLFNAFFQPSFVTANGQSFPRRATVDFEINPAWVTDDAANARTRIFVPDECLWATDPRVGVTMGAAGDQSSLVNTGLALTATAADGGTFGFPPGTVTCNATLNIPTSIPVRIKGAGSYSTVLSFPTDLGAGHYAIGQSAVEAFVLENIGFLGPGWGSSPAVGGTYCAMDGIQAAAQCLIHDVRAAGFHSGALVVQSHQEFRDCDFQGNDYGLRWGPNAGGGLGDQMVVRCFMTNCLKGGIGVDQSNTIADCVFIQGHIGFSPYGIHRYGSGVSNRAGIIAGSTFWNTSFEYCGNAMIQDDPGDGVISNVTFDAGGQSSILVNAYRWPAKPVGPAMINVYEAQQVFWRNLEAWGQFLPASASIIKAAAMFDIRSDIAEPSTLATVLGGSKLFLGAGTWSQFANTISVLRLGAAAGNSLLIEHAWANEAIPAGALVERDGYTNCRVSRNNATSMLLGVSVAAFAQGDVCSYVSSCASGHRIPVKSVVGALQGQLLKPDSANNGCVAPAASLADVPIIGRVYAGNIAANSTGFADLRFG